jgi:tetratricopeptide (TPR) repeat protein
LEHWLADEPVSAYREPALTRLVRWGRRHRPLVAGAAALLLTTVIALGVGLVLLGQANARTEHQRQRAEANFVEAQRQRDLAHRAVDDYFVQVSENTLLSQPGLQTLRKELLESALKYYQEFVRQGGDDTELQAELAQAYLRVGRITREIARSADGLNAFLRAQDLYEALSKADPQNVSYRGGLAQAYRYLGLAKMRAAGGADAITLFRQAIALDEELVPSNPDVPDFQSDLARSYNNLGITESINGQAAKGRGSFRKAIATWERLIRIHPRAEFRFDLGEAYSNLGVSHWSAGQIPDALKANQEAVTLYQKLAAENGAAPTYKNGLAFALDNLGNAYLSAGQRLKAVEAYQKSVEIAEDVVRENPSVTLYLERVILDRIDLGHGLLHAGRDNEARHSFELALKLSTKLPPGPSDYFSYASIHRGLGKVLRKQGQTAAALEAVQKAVQIGMRGPGGEKPFTTYELACSRALCSALVGEGKADLTAAEQKAKRDYAEQAMAALREAIAEGWENRAWMEKDPDLEALGSLPEFHKLMQDLQDKAKEP